MVEVLRYAAELRKWIISKLNSLRPLARADGSATVHIDLGGLPDPADPFTWRPSENRVHVPDSPPWCTFVFLKETLVGLAEDNALAWPTGSVEVRFFVEMPRWCSLASNSAAVAASRRAWKEDGAQELELPQSEESEEMMLVTFGVTENAHGWHGLEPETFEARTDSWMPSSERYSEA